MKAIMMDPKDNVATLLSDAEAGVTVVITSKDGDAIKEVKVQRKIPFGHKIATEKIERSQKVLKYGEVIGEASGTIGEGEHVHVHNVKSLRGAKF